MINNNIELTGKLAMTQEIINVGTPDGNDGDTIRDAFIKVNNNFAELYVGGTINTLPDVDASRLQDGAVLVYENKVEKWVATTTLEKQNIDAGEF